MTQACRQTILALSAGLYAGTVPTMTHSIALTAEHHILGKGLMGGIKLIRTFKCYNTCAFRCTKQSDWTAIFLQRDK